MPRHSLLNIALLGLTMSGSGVAFGWAVRLRRTPEAVFGVTRRDLGRVRVGAEAKTVTFPIRNAGRGPLLITSVGTGCGCTRARYPKSLPAGAEGEIAVRYTPDAAWSGHHETVVRVRTNDPRRRQQSLTVTAELVPILGCTPENPISLSLRRGETARKEVLLTPRRDRNLRVLKAESLSPSVKAELKRASSSDPQRPYRLLLTAAPRREPGDFEAVIRLRTTDPDLPEPRLRVIGEARTGPVARPASLRVASLAAREAGKELAVLSVFSRSRRLRLRRIETGDPALLAETGEPDPEGVIPVTLKYAGGWRPGHWRRTLRIRTDDPHRPVLRVPLEATVY